ncbi:unnamed protein product [Cylicocyclus nassatus]|uniref:Uncharacterized protein n=1 Tax=Cylicocyclus nassatus TaxID=53992 RepID=A0AA36MAQ3_CYLNA|nr:unnamed protein product [Cylicocyclus nassatus]
MASKDDSAYSSVYIFIKDILEKIPISKQWIIYGCFAFMKIALCVLLIFWQWNTSGKQTAASITFDMDDTLLQDLLPLGAGKPKPKAEK